MMTKINVNLKLARTVQTAKTILQTVPPDHYDALVVSPGRCKVNNEAELRDISAFISRPPYKLPLLGIYFDGEETATVNFSMKQLIRIQDCIFTELLLGRWMKSLSRTLYWNGG